MHFFFLLAPRPFILPCFSDLPTMKKLGQRTSSQPHWKPSDTLHYIVLVPIKADTIFCQKNSDTLQKRNPPLLHPLPRGDSVFLDIYYVVTRGSTLSDGRPNVRHQKLLLKEKCLLCKFPFKPLLLEKCLFKHKLLILEFIFGWFQLKILIFCKSCEMLF